MDIKALFGEIRDVDMNDDKGTTWKAEKAIGTTAVNTCLAMIYFYRESGLARIMLRHASPVHYSTLAKLVSSTREEIKSQSITDCIVYFGLTKDDDLSKDTAKKLQTMQDNEKHYTVYALQQRSRIFRLRPRLVEKFFENWLGGSEKNFPWGGNF